MKQYKTRDIRNVGLIGHGASGKTSVAEAMLYIAGVSDRLGKVGDNSSVMDYDPDEVRRGHSISASLAYYEWAKNKVNLIDTPGSSNFIADTKACLRAVDGVVVVVNAVEGVQFYTEKVWKWADEQLLQKLVFVNRMDHELADMASVLGALKKKFQVKPVLLQMPVGKGEGFTGVVDLIDNIYFAYGNGGSGRGRRTDMPAEAMEEAEIYRAELIETVAETADELLEKYLESGELSHDEFCSGLKQGIRDGKVVPVLCGSATLNIGVELLMQAVIDYLPSPDCCAPVKARSDDTEITLTVDEMSPPVALVFKTIADPYTGKLTLFRVFSGFVKTDTSVYNVTKQAGEKIGQVFALQGKKQIPVQEVTAGDIGAVAKLKVTVTGDTLGKAEAGTILESIKFPLPVMARALVPKTRADEEKISNALHRLVEEDPTLKIDREAQTHELLVLGMGQVHLDVILERMKRRFGVDVEVKSPKVPYRETIRGSAKVQGKYKKQTGGHGQYGDTWLEISPLERGGGFQFENRIVGGVIPKQYIPAVEKGVHEAMSEGILAHYPMVDIKVALYDGSYHDVDSSELAFKIAASLGFKKGVGDCKPILLEPIMHIEINVPSESVGDIIGDLNSKRGRILGVEGSVDTQNILAHIPLASVLNYAADLTALTAGKGSFVVEFSHYDDVPEHISAKIVEESRLEHKKG